MIITRAMPTQQTALTGVSQRIPAGQEIRNRQRRGPGDRPLGTPFRAAFPALAIRALQVEVRFGRIDR